MISVIFLLPLTSVLTAVLFTSIFCSDDDDELISDGWIDTVRASLNDNQRQSRQQPINGQHHTPTPVTSYGDVKPRPITIQVRPPTLLASVVLGNERNQNANY